MKKLEIIISGRVQGVGFRYFTVRQAQEFNIIGNVRNSYDGKVRVIAVGSKENMELFLEKLRQGSRMASVENMNITDLAAVQDFTNFRIVY
jgi:acylphosphatase